MCWLVLVIIIATIMMTIAIGDLARSIHGIADQLNEFRDEFRNETEA